MHGDEYELTVVAQVLRAHGRTGTPTDYVHYMYSPLYYTGGHTGASSSPSPHGHHHGGGGFSSTLLKLLLLLLLAVALCAALAAYRR